MKSKEPENQIDEGKVVYHTRLVCRIIYYGKVRYSHSIFTNKENASPIILFVKNHGNSLTTFKLRNTFSGNLDNL